MPAKAFIPSIFCILLSLHIAAQSDRIPIGNRQNDLLDRLDIKLQNDSVMSFSIIKPYNRKLYTQRVEWLDSMDKAGSLPVTLSKVDRYNINSLLMSNAEWTKDEGAAFRRKKPFLKYFFKTDAHLYESYSKDFTIIVDPVLNLQAGKSSKVENALFVNTRGVSIRGNINKKIGFYSYLTENQERDPLFAQQYTSQHNGLPNAGYYKNFKRNGYDYFDARGGIDFAASKFFNFRFGYDKLFIGNGYRSLLLSDFSNNFLYLQMDVQLKKFSYKSVYAELIAPFDSRQNRDTVRYKNYMAFHHLGIQLNKWLNVGVYENVLYNGSNGFELSYLNPVIFYRAVEMQMGSGTSKATIGVDAKANIKKTAQVYGQFVIGEFVFKELLRYGRGSWLNKQALQLGGKYINVAGIDNLDLLVEANWVRPFMYTHSNESTGFTHYNKELAHPLGANFSEYIAIVKYQPLNRLYLTGKLFYSHQGLDSAGQNMGNNLFLSYYTRPRDYDFFIGTGELAKRTQVSLSASYEFLQNLFVDVNISNRFYDIPTRSQRNEFFFSMGLRWNIARREFEF
ncbi:MAG: hypothetical protein KIT80_18220 [Chitinophagaceae bacterium]|nr:hypothetical protein [Chitinophagaceae bacterium]MCW5928861.1 hypothetical protein [Chitinophagaceae bacterium]